MTILLKSLCIGYIINGLVCHFCNCAYNLFYISINVMNKIIMSFVLITLVSGCSAIKERSKKRDLQSKIIRALNAKVERFSSCAKTHDIYKAFNLERVRVELQLKINSKGQVDMFQLDNKAYSEQFIDCLFKTVDIIIFPSLNKGEVIELTQPMIFTKN